MAEQRHVTSPARFVIRLVAVLGFEICSIVALHWVGRYQFLQINWDDLDRWFRDTASEDAAAALVRLAGLALCYWLLASTLIYTAGVLADLPHLLRSLTWVMVPGVRRLLDGMLALSITSSTVTAATHAPPPTALTALTPEPQRPPENAPTEDAAYQMASSTTTATS